MAVSWSSSPLRTQLILSNNPLFPGTRLACATLECIGISSQAFDGTRLFSCQTYSHLPGAVLPSVLAVPICSLWRPLASPLSQPCHQPGAGLEFQCLFSPLRRSRPQITPSLRNFNMQLVTTATWGLLGVLLLACGVFVAFVRVSPGVVAALTRGTGIRSGSSPLFVASLCLDALVVCFWVACALSGMGPSPWLVVPLRISAAATTLLTGLVAVRHIPPRDDSSVDSASNPDELPLPCSFPLQRDMGVVLPMVLITGGPVLFLVSLDISSWQMHPPDVAVGCAIVAHAVAAAVAMGLRKLSDVRHVDDLVDREEVLTHRLQEALRARKQSFRASPSTLAGSWNSIDGSSVGSTLSRVESSASSRNLHSMPPLTVLRRAVRSIRKETVWNQTWALLRWAAIVGLLFSEGALMQFLTGADLQQLVGCVAALFSGTSVILAATAHALATRRANGTGATLSSVWLRARWCHPPASLGRVLFPP
jgi:hypothetical protein